MPEPAVINGQTREPSGEECRTPVFYITDKTTDRLPKHSA